MGTSFGSCEMSHTLGRWCATQSAIAEKTGSDSLKAHEERFADEPILRQSRAKRKLKSKKLMKEKASLHGST
jgi:hypothetical protein